MSRYPRLPSSQELRERRRCDGEGPPKNGGATLYAWGWSGFGQTGTGRAGGHVAAPEEVAFSFGTVDAVDAPDSIVRVACAEFHTLALDGDGAVWSWGRGADGALGHGDDGGGDVAVPIRVNLSLGADQTNARGGDYGGGVGVPRARLRRRALAIACGAAHSVAVLEGGELAAWGRNERGQ